MNTIWAIILHYKPHSYSLFPPWPTYAVILQSTDTKKKQVQSHNRKLPVEEQQIRAADDGWSQLLT